MKVTWHSGQRFDCELPSGVSLTLDGDGKDGFSPMQALLASLAGCMGIDVVIILEKMRIGFAGLQVSIDGERLDDPPRRFRTIRMHFRIMGTVPRDKAEHAVQLSFEKYCSVFHTLRADIDFETTIKLDSEA